MRRLLPFLAPLALPAQQPPLRLEHEVLHPGVHVFSGFANGNVLVMEGRDGLFLVDAQSAKRVAELDSAIRTVSRLPVRWIANTHYHGDHTEGNALFRGRGAEVWAHPQVRAQAAKDTTIAALQWHRTPLAREAMPTRDVATALDTTFGGQRVILRHYGPAHTDGDLLVWLPAHNVLHIGDLFEVGAPPFVDWWAGGSLDGVIRVIDEVLPALTDATRIVPGHGAVSRKADLVRYREMLATVQQRVREGIARDTPSAELQKTAVAGYEALLGGERGAVRFAGIVILGLRGR